MRKAREQEVWGATETKLWDKDCCEGNWQIIPGNDLLDIVVNTTCVNVKNMDRGGKKDQLLRWALSVPICLSLPVPHIHPPRGSHQAAQASEQQGHRTFICVTRWNILTWGPADSKTPWRGGGEWGGGARFQQGFSKKWERDKNECCVREMSATKLWCGSGEARRSSHRRGL